MLCTPVTVLCGVTWHVSLAGHHNPWERMSHTLLLLAVLLGGVRDIELCEELFCSVICIITMKAFMCMCTLYMCTCVGRLSVFLCVCIVCMCTMLKCVPVCTCMHELADFVCVYIVVYSTRGSKGR